MGDLHKVRITQMWELHRFERATQNVGQMWDLHKCENYTNERTTQIWKNYTDVNEVPWWQMWKNYTNVKDLHTCEKQTKCENYTNVKELHKCERITQMTELHKRANYTK